VRIVYALPQRLPDRCFSAAACPDARRCISYWTIEHKGWIDRDLRSRFGNWVYGCDVCQEACPFQRFAPLSSALAADPAHIDRVAPSLLDLLALDPYTFNQHFATSPLKRIGRDRLVRNACIAAGNWGSDQAVSPLERLLSDPNPLVRGHAAWALGKINLSESALRLRYSYETDAEVRGEISAALSAS